MNIIKKAISKFRWLLQKKMPSLLWSTYYKYYKVQHELKDNKNKRDQIIVSLTSYPDRFNNLYVTLYSLFNQTLKPDLIVLYLTELDFIQLPNKIKELCKYGLKLKIVDDDMKSHKKYLYSMQEFPESLIVTVDDDLIYDKKMIERLYETYLRYPNCIIANRVHKIVKNDKGDILPYNNWIYECKDTKIPDKYLLATTGAGTLFPPHLMYEEDLFNKVLIKQLSDTSDDIWLKFMQILNKTSVVWTGYTKKLIVTKGTQTTSLAKLNVTQNYNDICIRNLEKHYNIKMTELL